MFNTYPNNPFPPSSENAGGAGEHYELPIASAETLGGVKVGNNLTIGENGALSANKQVADYSTEEHATGQKWIDGKDIYFKTIDFGALPNSTTKSVSSGLTNEFIVKMDAFAYKSDAFYPLPFVSVTTLNDCIRTGYNKTNHTVDIVTSGDKTTISAYVTLYYTKTT